ncbi:metallophosphoesterase family protein [Phaeodactylibacter xiamenensis]|jgi:putative phosphoesterase|uniref:metallophosphoesterase family protein n=1 Tax=Phaeodactylibacter xiamenensis TaxID=1524460 RepID=UPI0024A85574|nr:metallophosphoesterase family protein [Phaeodactylibacter xiamenensis]
MKRIGLISDTHSHLEESVFKYFEPCDEIWHAGDIGDASVVDQLEAFRPLRAVYGNIDDAPLRRRFPEDLRFAIEGVDVFMTHIGGYPGRYNRRVREILSTSPPDLYICGHSHILKVMPDKKLGLLHVNPGAAGNHGFHKVKTIIRFSVDQGRIEDFEVIELGQRGAIPKNGRQKPLY